MNKFMNKWINWSIIEWITNENLFQKLMNPWTNECRNWWIKDERKICLLNDRMNTQTDQKLKVRKSGHCRNH